MIEDAMKELFSYASLARSPKMGSDEEVILRNLLRVRSSMALLATSGLKIAEQASKHRLPKVTPNIGVQIS